MMMAQSELITFRPAIIISFKGSIAQTNASFRFSLFNFRVYLFPLELWKVSISKVSIFQMSLPANKQELGGEEF